MRLSLLQRQDGRRDGRSTETFAGPRAPKLGIRAYVVRMAGFLPRYLTEGGGWEPQIGRAQRFATYQRADVAMEVERLKELRRAGHPPVCPLSVEYEVVE